MSCIVDASGAIPMDIPTPLVLLAPQLARQISLMTFIHVGATAVILWDAITNLKNEFKLLYYYKVRFPTYIYFVSRLSLLAYCLGRAVLLTHPVPNCSAFMNFLNGALIVFVSCTTSFFFLRVCAVYNMHKGAIAFFGFLWLSTVAMIILFTRTFTATPIGSSGYCMEQVDGLYLGPMGIVLLTNDSIIFAAITYRVYCMYLDAGAPVLKKLDMLVFGTSLPILSRVILQDSQLYCLISVVMKAVIVIYAYHFDGPMQVMLIICHLVVVNILCCRVYRDLIMAPRIHPAPTQTMNLTSVEFRVTLERPAKESVTTSPVFGGRTLSRHPSGMGLNSMAASVPTLPRDIAIDIDPPPESHIYY